MNDDDDVLIMAFIKLLNQTFIYILSLLFYPSTKRPYEKMNKKKKIVVEENESYNNVIYTMCITSNPLISLLSSELFLLCGWERDETLGSCPFLSVQFYILELLLYTNKQGC